MAFLYVVWVYHIWKQLVVTALVSFLAARDHWIVKTLSELRVKIDGLTHLIQRVVNEHVTTLSLPDNIILPVDTLEDLGDLEQLLTDEQLRDRLVS